VFQTPVEGAIFAEIIDRLRALAAIRPAVVDISALVHTTWDLGSPLNTVTWYLQLVGAEIRVIDCDSDLDLTPVQRVARILAKGYLYGSHYLPHDAMPPCIAGRRSQRTNRSGLAQLQGGATDPRHLGRHQPASPDLASLHVPHPGLRARIGGAVELSHGASHLYGSCGR
jgi:hypothetical protein